ncbi:hypothetical protein ACFY0N_10395 [Streptomyces vinaceus]|uniref:hypothetical protein n=1 Tax=Streptomyces vinaceus TaxID=1960 RepID=UPI003688A9EB
MGIFGCGRQPKSTSSTAWTLADMVRLIISRTASARWASMWATASSTEARTEIIGQAVHSRVRFEGFDGWGGGTRSGMFGYQERFAGQPSGLAQADEPPSPRHRARRGRGVRVAGRLRRRFLAYRDIEFMSTHIPGDPGPGEECLLLVDVRKIVGRVHYRLCVDCADAVITGIVIDDRFLSTGLGTRALSHLRSRHPGLSWRSTLSLRATRELLRRMRIPVTAAQGRCPHTQPA